MKDFFLFGDVSLELITVLILGAIVIVCGWAYGVVNLVRFYKKRARRSLVAGILCILIAPVLAFALFLADLWLVNYRTGPLFHDNSLLGSPSGNN